MKCTPPRTWLFSGRDSFLLPTLIGCLLLVCPSFSLDGADLPGMGHRFDAFSFSSPPSFSSNSSFARLPALGLNASYVTVSGLSSGAYFSVQMHVAYSRSLQGNGAVAGGPYFCAGLPPKSITQAQTACMADPSLIDVDYLAQTTRRTAATTGTIDPVRYLANDRVYVFAGTNDSVVHPDVGRKLERYYGEFVTTPGNVLSEYSIGSEHSMPTLAYGNACSYLGEPYINRCSYDTVGHMLQHLFANQLQEPSESDRQGRGNGDAYEPAGDFLEFSQAEFLDVAWTLKTAALHDYGLLYLPPNCQNNHSSSNSDGGAAETSAPACRLHVAYHGCKQSIPLVGTQYYTHAGYLPWADANDIVVLFPQSIKTIVNPMACWDWFGYTGADYASNLGEQMRVNKKMIDRLISKA